MVAGQACTVCAHPRRSEVDFELLDPKTGYTRVANAYALHKDAVRRHKVNGHVIVPRPAPPPEQPAPGEATAPPARKTAVEVLAGMLATMEERDTADLSGREYNVFIEAKRRVAADLAKYQVAVDREGPAQRELRALEEMVIAADEALEAFPDARAAVAAATHAWKARKERGADAAEA